MKSALLRTGIWRQWQTNHRLRLGIIVIVAICLYLVYQAMADVVGQVEVRCQEHGEQIARLQGLVGQDAWQQRRDDARNVRLVMESRLLQADSRGLAQASAQTWLDSVLKKQQIKQSRVQVDPPVQLAHLAGVWQVAASMQGVFQPQALVNILLELESSSHLLVVDRLEVQGNKRQRFKIDIRIFTLVAGNNKA